MILIEISLTYFKVFKAALKTISSSFFITVGLGIKMLKRVLGNSFPKIFGKVKGGMDVHASDGLRQIPNFESSLTGTIG